MLGNFQYATRDRSKFDEPDSPVVTGFDLDGDDDNYGSEVSYLFRSNYVNLVTVIVYFDLKSKIMLPQI